MPEPVIRFKKGDCVDVKQSPEHDWIKGYVLAVYIEPAGDNYDSYVLYAIHDLKKDKRIWAADVSPTLILDYDSL